MRPRSLNNLEGKRLQQEGELMPDMLEEFTRQSIAELLRELPVEKRLEGLTPEQRVQGLAAETLLALAEKLKSDKPSSPTPSGPVRKGVRHRCRNGP